MDLSYSLVHGNTSHDTGVLVHDQMLLLLYGVWGVLDTPLLVTSHQYAQCRGQDTRHVIRNHPHFSEARTVNFTAPQFKVTRMSSPKFVIVLEN